MTATPADLHAWPETPPEGRWRYHCMCGDGHDGSFNGSEFSSDDVGDFGPDEFQTGERFEYLGPSEGVASGG